MKLHRLSVNTAHSPCGPQVWEQTIDWIKKSQRRRMNPFINSVGRGFLKQPRKHCPTHFTSHLESVMVAPENSKSLKDYDRRRDMPFSKQHMPFNFLSSLSYHLWPFSIFFHWSIPGRLLLHSVFFSIIAPSMILLAREFYITIMFGRLWSCCNRSCGALTELFSTTKYQTHSKIGFLLKKLQGIEGHRGKEST